MFLNQVEIRNPKLIETVVELHQQGLILPDTYVVDIDTLLENAKLILNEAHKYNMKLYFMLKQLGRNPYIGKKLIELGYDGAVVVDFKEAQVMMNNNIHICNVGHLVQPPFAMLQKLVDYGCDYFTVFSLQKIMDINECAKKAGKVQKLIVKVVGEDDFIYSGQTGGFQLDELPKLIEAVKKLSNVEVKGVTSFPCFLYDNSIGDVVKTNNLNTVLYAKEIFENNGISIENINTPSTTCVHTIGQMAAVGANSSEPGHGLTGTTPLHAEHECEEIPCVVYLSEVSHNFSSSGYIYV